MPKDNEVDEKVVAYGRDLDGTGSLHPCAKGDIGAIALCDAATVAELRAKAAAAERRVGELEAALRDVLSEHANDNHRPNAFYIAANAIAKESQ